MTNTRQMEITMDNATDLHQLLSDISYRAANIEQLALLGEGVETTEGVRLSLLAAIRDMAVATRESVEGVCV